MYFHANLNFSKFNKKCICWWMNNIKLLALFATMQKLLKTFDWKTYISRSEYNIKMYRKYMHCKVWHGLTRFVTRYNGKISLSWWWTLPFHNRGILDQLSEYQPLTQVPVSFSWSDIVKGKPNYLEKKCRTDTLSATNLKRTGKASKPCLRDDRLVTNVQIMFLWILSLFT